MFDSRRAIAYKTYLVITSSTMWRSVCFKLFPFNIFAAKVLPCSSSLNITVKCKISVSNCAINPSDNVALYAVIPVHSIRTDFAQRSRSLPEVL